MRRKILKQSFWIRKNKGKCTRALEEVNVCIEPTRGLIDGRNQHQYLQHSTRLIASAVPPPVCAADGRLWPRRLIRSTKRYWNSRIMVFCCDVSSAAHQGVARGWPSASSHRRSIHIRSNPDHYFYLIIFTSASLIWFHGRVSQLGYKLWSHNYGRWSKASRTAGMQGVSRMGRSDHRYHRAGNSIMW